MKIHGVLPHLGPVSYTHLDVYKRQEFYGAETGTLRKENMRRLEGNLDVAENREGEVGR